MFLQLNMDNVLNATDILGFNVMHDPITNEWVLYAQREAGSFTVYSDITKANVDKVLCDILVLMKETPLNVEEQIKTSVKPEVINVVADKNVVKGQDITVTINFKGSIKLATELQINAGAKLTKKGDITISGQKATVVYTGATVGEETITAKTTMGSLTRETKVNVLDTAPVLTTLEMTPDNIRVGGTTKAIATFDKAPTTDIIKFYVQGLDPKGKPVVAGNTVTQDYTWDGAGFEGKVTVVSGDKTISKLVELNHDATIKSIIPTKTVAEIEEQIPVSIHFDKAFVDGQANLKVTYPDGFVEAQAFAMDGTKTRGSLKVKGTKGTQGNIIFELGGGQVPMPLEILPKAIPVKLSLDKTTLNVGEKTKLYIDFNRDVKDPNTVTINYPGGVTGASHPTLINSGYNGVVEITANAEGAKEIGVTANQERENINLEIINPIKFIGINITTEKPTALADFNYEIEFNKPPLLSNAYIHGTDNLEIKTKAIQGNKITGTAQAVKEGKNLIICEYDGLGSFSKSVLIGEAKPTLILVSAEPTGIKVGQVSTVTMTFGGKAPELAKISANPNANLRKQGEIILKGMVATCKFEGQSVGAGLVQCSYNGGVSKNANITIQPTLQSISKSKDALAINDDAVFTATFDGTPTLNDAIWSSSSGLQKRGEPIISEHTIQATYVAIGEPAEGQFVKCTSHGIEQTVFLRTNAGYKSISANPNSIQIDQDTTITVAFTHPPRLGDMVFNSSAGLRKKTEPSISGNNVTTMYTAIGTPGEQWVEHGYNNQKHKVTINTTAKPASAFTTQVGGEN